jgi:hypothetical protein
MSGPAAAPVKPDATMTHSEQNEIFGPPAGGAAAPPPPPAAPAAAAPPPAAPAAAPAALPAADPNAAAPDAGTAPAGEGTASPAAAAAPETPAEVEARVLKGVVEKLLAGKPAAPAAPTQIPDPPHIKQARDVMALTEERYNEIYDGFVEGARTGKDPNGYRKAEQLASLRANAPYHVWQYDQTLETRRTASAGIERQQKAEADAALAQLNANPETKDWQTYR